METCGVGSRRVCCAQMSRTLLLCSTMLLLISVTVLAQEGSSWTPPDKLLKVCSKTVPRPCIDKQPIVTRQPIPQFSEEAKVKKIEGVVVLGLVVGTDGLPHDIHIVKTLGYGLDEMAIQAVEHW